MEDNTGFMQGDSLGLSQGQGRGLAQVFDSTYNPVFKEELIRNIKSDKEDKKAINSQLDSVIKNTVWSRDQPLLQEKTKDLQSFAQQNYREINKGNTQEAFEYKQKIMDIANFAKASKVAEDSFTKAWSNYSNNIDKFDEEETEGLLSKFYGEAGNFNIDQIKLIPKLDKTSHLGKMSGLVQKLKMDIETKPGYKDAYGQTIYTKVEETVQENIDALAEENFRDDKRIQKAFGSLENYKASLRPFGKYDKSQVIKGEPGKSKTADEKDEEFTFSITPVSNRQFSQKVGGGGKLGFTPDKTPVLDEIPFNVTMTEAIPPSRMKELGAVPFNVSNIYQAKKDGDEWDMKETYKGSNIFDQSGSAVMFKPSSVLSIPVFKDDILKGTHTVKVNGKSTTIKDGKVTVTRPNGNQEEVDLKGITLSDDQIKDGKFKGITLSDDLIEFKPFTLGVYEMELGYGQDNFEALVPYENFRTLLQATPSNRRQLEFIETKAQESGALNPKSYSEFQRRKGIKTTTQNTTTEKKQKVTPMTKEQLQKFIRDKSKDQKYEVTDKEYKEYLDKLNK